MSNQNFDGINNNSSQAATVISFGSKPALIVSNSIDKSAQNIIPKNTTIGSAASPKILEDKTESSTFILPKLNPAPSSKPNSLNLETIKNEIQIHSQKDYFKNLIESKINSGKSSIELFELPEKKIINSDYSRIQKMPNNKLIISTSKIDLSSKTLFEIDPNKILLQKNNIESQEVPESNQTPTIQPTSPIPIIKLTPQDESEKLSSFWHRYNRHFSDAVANNYRTVLSATFTLAIVSMSVGTIMSAQNPASYSNSQADAISIDPNGPTAQREKYKNCLIAEGILSYISPIQDADSDGLTNLEECKIGSKILNSRSCGDRTDLESLVQLIDPATCQKLDNSKTNQLRFHDIVNYELLNKVIDLKSQKSYSEELFGR
jgi:hypothetical protein